MAGASGHSGRKLRRPMLTAKVGTPRRQKLSPLEFSSSLFGSSANIPMLLKTLGKPVIEACRRVRNSHNVDSLSTARRAELYMEEMQRIGILRRDVLASLLENSAVAPPVRRQLVDCEQSYIRLSQLKTAIENQFPVDLHTLRLALGRYAKVMPFCLSFGRNREALSRKQQSEFLRTAKRFGELVIRLMRSDKGKTMPVQEFLDVCANAGRLEKLYEVYLLGENPSVVAHFNELVETLDAALGKLWAEEFGK